MERVVPSGHGSVLRRARLGDDAVFTLLLGADGVGKVRRTHITIALGILTMARRTIVRENLPTRLDYQKISRYSGKVYDILLL